MKRLGNLCLSALLIIGLFAEWTPQTQAQTTNLNDLLKSNFAKWDALLTRYASTNGTVTDIYDFSKVLTDSRTTLSTIGFYLLALTNFYEETGNQYYLSKAQAFVDNFLTGSWWTVSTDKGVAIYTPGYWYNDRENDASCLILGIAGSVSLKLYEWTGQSKYKTWADSIAFQSYNWFPAVNNNTDLAWVSSYYTTPRTEALAKIGVNRQGALGVFYSLYSQYDTNYGEYVPNIFNWMWRAQKADYGLSYDIGGGNSDLPYTAWAFWFAMLSYEQVPTRFDSGLVAKLNNTLTYLSKRASTNHYLTNVMVAAALAKAIKSGFVSFPSERLLEQTKTYFYTALRTLFYSEKGIVNSINEYPYGFRWSQYSLGALFASYPLPTDLASYSSAYVYLTNYATGRYYVEGSMLQAPTQQKSIYVGDIYDNNGERAYPFDLLSTKTGTGAKSRTARVADGIVHTTVEYATTPKTFTYYYPDMSFYTNVTGTSYLMLYGSGFAPSQFILKVANGTEYNHNDLSAKTYLLSTPFLVYRNSSGSENSALVYTQATTSWTLSKTESSITWQTASLTDYNVSWAYVQNWEMTLNSAATYAMLQTMATNIQSQTILSYDTAITNFITLMEDHNTEPAWLDTYETTLAFTPKLVAHNLPQIVSITAWNYASQILCFTVSALSGTTSTTKVHVGDKGTPTSVHVSNGSSSWNFNASTSLLKLEVSHIGSVQIIIDWRTSGDVNGDGRVDSSDLSALSQAFGSFPSSSNWNQTCDLNYDNVVNVSDLYLTSRNYNKPP